MVKISQIEYQRPNKDEVLSTLKSFKQRFENAETVEEFYQVHEEYKAYDEKLGTNIRIAFIRFTQDTRNEFYAAEQDFLDEVGPEISVASAEISKCYLQSKFRSELEKRFPKVMFQNLQMQVDATNPLIVEDRIEQNKLTTRYSKLMSSIVVDFNGEKLPLSAMPKYFGNEDRGLRKSAYVAFGQALEDNKEQLDEIYHQLVKVRTNMGQKLGFEGFSPLGYLQMQRNCYTKEDLAKFRANVFEVHRSTKCKIASKGWRRLEPRSTIRLR